MQRKYADPPPQFADIGRWCGFFMSLRGVALTQTYGITPSMSRRGNPYDNAMAENFFSILKTECIYRHKPATFAEANEMIDRYIYFYNYERIQLKTGEAPLARRLSA
ncbi:integrase core domain-containing protein [Intestinimonas massiliensis]|jgi:putative transposase|nr:integrase core domain-containing protein [Intestinimonas massiliensis (ex Afouda et al. 2020)]MCQ4807974.1 integrase core domain-containing protein [Intestinimonas massiliensis (ex Afouda et al. 2020)]